MSMWSGRSGRVLGLVIGLVIGLAMGPGGALRAQDLPDIPDLTRVISSQQATAMGLEKLSPSEVAALNRAARLYAMTAMRVAAMRSAPAGAPPVDAPGSQPSYEPPTAPPAAPAGGVIESRIDGEFTGWTGETIFKLMNGQIWQQTNYAYRYHYAYSPKVLIYASGGVANMKVDGVDGDVTVRRLK